MMIWIPTTFVLEPAVKIMQSQRIRRGALRRASASMWVLVITHMVCLFIAGPAKAERVEPSSIYVVDGDTVRVGADSLRLIGLDTPETYEPRCDYELALGQAATARLRELIVRGDGVDLIVLPGRDRYDRGLAQLFVGGKNIADILISEGLARPYVGGRRLGWCG